METQSPGCTPGIKKHDGLMICERKLSKHVTELSCWTNSRIGVDSEKLDRKCAGLDSGVLAPSQSFSLTFDQPGEYSYFCVLHPDMQGTIIVD